MERIGSYDFPKNIAISFQPVSSCSWRCGCIHAQKKAGQGVRRAVEHRMTN
jgi:hypothetical protein